MKVASSKREAREFINGNAISINGVKETNPELIIDSKFLLDNTYIIIKRGKKANYLAKAK